MPQFDLEIFCRAIQTHKITYAAIVPPILLGLCKSPIVDKYDLSSIRCFMSAAAPLTPELVKETYKRLKIPVKQAYGLTETSPGTHIQVNLSPPPSLLLPFPFSLPPPKYQNNYQQNHNRNSPTGKAPSAPWASSSRTKPPNTSTQTQRAFSPPAKSASSGCAAPTSSPATTTIPPQQPIA